MHASDNHTQHIFAALAATAFLIGIVAPIGLFIWQATSPSAALREGAAGTLVSATVDRSVLPDWTLTRVDTSTGSVVVHGVFAGLTGSRLVVAQLNKSQGLHLCLAGTHTGCTELAGTWAGPLIPTAAGRTVVDFQRYGLTPRHLARVLGFGAMTLAIVILLGGLALCGDDDECVDTGIAT